MKKLLAFLLLLLFNIIFSQKILISQFKQYDFEKISPVLIYLGSEIQKKYKDDNKVVFYDNLFRVNIVGQKLDIALNQIDSVRSFYMKNNPTIANAMGTQYEVYIKTLKNANSRNDFDGTYKKEFSAKYESLPVKSKIILSHYFYIDIEKTKKDILLSLKNDFENKDSVEVKKAIMLCRNYNSYIVASKSFDLAKKYFKELDSEYFEVRDSVLINNQISARIVLNKKMINPESTILVNTIYTDSEDIDEQKEQAGYGYHSVYMYPRGKYISNSKIEPFEHEAEDINDVIDWIIKQPWSNGKVGMIGGSYLGFSQWAATKKIHPALKTIIPQASVGIGTMDFPMNNNVFMSYTMRWLDYVTTNKTINEESFSDEEKWNNIYKKWYVSGAAFNKLDSIVGSRNDIFQRWLLHPSFDSYWQSMAPNQTEFSKINIPILTTTGYFDSDQIGALYYLRNHYKYNKSANHYMIIGPYDHSGGQGFIRDEIQGLKIDPIAKINLNEICFQWFDYILKDKTRPSFLKGKVNYQVMGTNEWKSTNSINDFNKDNLKFYITANNELSLKKEVNKSFISLKIDLKNRSDADELIKQKDNILDSMVYNSNAIIFSSNLFEKSVEFTGNFIGDLKFSVNKKDVDLYMKLYEQNKDGKYFLLSSYFGRASYAKNPEKRKLLHKYKKTEIIASNNEFVSKKIEKGSKLVLVLGVIKSPYMQINYGTGKDVSEETIEDAKEPLEIKFYNDSFIEIPVSKN